MKMMKRNSFFISFVLIFTLVLSGCSGGLATEPPQKDAQANQTQAAQLQNGFDQLLKASQDLLKKDLPMITVDEVYEKVVLEGSTDYLVVDVRAADAFAKGHIEGAVNIPYELTAKPNMIANLPKDKTVIVACYSGHTASQTAALWRMLGYNAIPMENGMGGWNHEAGSALVQYDFPVVTDVPEAATYELPTIKAEGVSDLQSLIIQQSQAFLASGKGPIINGQKLKEALDSNDTNHFLVDIRSAEDYGKGHIAGSINIPYQNIVDLDQLKKLPTDKKVVLIGYNGLDASQVVRVLNQLGYDSYALMQGMRVWTTNGDVNGIAPAATEVIMDYPLKQLQYNLDGGGGGSASCG